MLLGIEFGQKYYRLQVLGVGEEVHGLEAGGLPAPAGEEGDVPGQGLGVTAHIHDALGGHGGDGGDKFRRGARPGRVQKDHVGAQALFGRPLNPLGGVGTEKTGVFDAVAGGIGGGVPHGGGGALHTDETTGSGGNGAQPDGAGAAVGIQHRFLAGEGGNFHGLVVQHFRLGGVHLIKAGSRDGKTQSAQGVQNMAGSVQHPHILAQHRAGMAGVAVMHHCGDPGGGLAQGSHKISAARQAGGGGDQHHHHLVGVYPAANQKMAHQAGVPVLVVGGPAAGAGGIQGGFQGLVEHFILQQASLFRHGQHMVGAGGVDACLQCAPALGKGGDGLVAVMQRFRLAQDGRHRRKAFQQGPGFLLFLGQLPFIGQLQQGAAAAFAGLQWTGEVGHKATSFIYKVERAACAGACRIWYTGDGNSFPARDMVPGAAYGGIRI